jgi:hypothetical protein
MDFQDQRGQGITLQSLARIRSQCPGLPGRVAEILGVTVDQVQELFGASPQPDAPGPVTK